MATEIEVYHIVRHPCILWNPHMQEGLYLTFEQEIFFLPFAARKKTHIEIKQERGTSPAVP